VDAVNTLVGERLSLLESRSGGGDGENATAVGDDLALGGGLSTGVEDVNVCGKRESAKTDRRKGNGTKKRTLGKSVESDLVSFGVRRRVSLRRQHNRNRRLLLHHELDAV
jgi:hypothetical protein